MSQLPEGAVTAQSSERSKQLRALEESARQEWLQLLLAGRPDRDAAQDWLSISIDWDLCLPAGAA
ncbi:MAG: hypothetical protein ACN6O2_08635 [Stenotrophomonas sp.]